MQTAKWGCEVTGWAWFWRYIAVLALLLASMTGVFVLHDAAEWGFARQEWIMVGWLFCAIYQSLHKWAFK